MSILGIILQWAVIQASAVYMQAAPDYESANVSQTGMGKVVEVLDRDRYWVKIRTPEPYEGWVNSLCLVEMTEEGRDGYVSSPRYICTEEYSHVYASPSERSARISDFLMGNIILQGGQETRQWAKVILPSGQEGWVRRSDVEDFRSWAEKPVRDITAVPLKFLGAAYVWGGMSVKGFDCSGLTGFSYFMNGILLPRDASEQVKCGEEVRIEDMRAGDLVFFGEERVSHVALCIAPGRIVHSSQIVRVNSLDPATASGPSVPPYYGRHIIAVRRILNHIDDGTGATSIIKSPLYFKQ